MTHDTSAKTNALLQQVIKQSSNHSVEKMRDSLLRGGRMTKVAGKAASYAPSLAGAAFLGLTFLGGSAGQVMAANECGPDGAGATIITCDAGNYAVGGVYPAYPTGITYNIDADAFTLELNDGDITVGGVGVRVIGTDAGNLSIIGTNVGNISVGAGIGLFAYMDGPTTATGTVTTSLVSGDITTTGTDSHGLYAINRGLGAALAEVSGGTVTTNSDRSRGVFAYVLNADSAATATVQQTGGTISTTGDNAFGLNAQTTGTGATLAEQSGGSITTAGANSYGLISSIISTDNDATATARLTAGDITTTGASAAGVFALTNGTGDVLAEQTGGSITTSGTNAIGLSTRINNAASTAKVTARITGGTIETVGAGSFGLYAQQQGLGDALAEQTGGSVTTAGDNSHGLYSFINNATSTAAVTGLVTGGTITTTGRSSRGILLQNRGLGDAMAEVTGGTITTDGEEAYAVHALIANAANTGTATAIQTAGNITTNGSNSSALLAQTTGTGATLAQMDGGMITTTKAPGAVNSTAVRSLINNTDSTATATAILNDGTINSAGIGVYAQTLGEGDALAQVNGGTITTTAISGHGLQSRIDNTASTATSTALLKDGTLDITRDSGYGVFATTFGQGAALAQMDGGMVTTAGGSGRGVFAFATNAANAATATAVLSAGDIVTTGGSASGVDALTSGLGETLAQVDGGTITTSGDGAHGMLSQTANTASTATATALLTAGDVVTTGSSSYGLYALTRGLGETLAQMDGGTVTTGNDGVALNAYAVYSLTTNTASTATTTSRLTGGSITTTGELGFAIYARTDGQGDTLTEIRGGSITTSGLSANGLQSEITSTTSTATSTALLTNGTITTAGVEARGLLARNRGLGDALAQMDAGSVTTSGIDANGVYAVTSNSVNPATAVTTALLNNGTIITTGDNGSGVFAVTNGLGATLAQVSGGSITTSGVGADGVRSLSNNATSEATLTANVTGGTVSTTGAVAHGIEVQHIGIGAVAVATGGTITTTGADAHGINIIHNNVATTGDATVTIASDISAGGDGVHINTATSGNTLVTGTGNITGGTDVGDDGISITAVSAVTVDVNGTITGDPGIVVTTASGPINIAGTGDVTGTLGDGVQASITSVAASDDITIARDGIISGGMNGILATNSGTGNNIITITSNVNGGSGAAISSNTVLDSLTTLTIDANVTAGAGGVAIANNEGDSLTTINAGTITGEIRLGNGDDSLTVTGGDVTGVTLFDGGDDVAVADGFIDTLTLRDQTLSLAGATVTNWENLVVDGGQLGITDGMLAVGGEPGTGLTLANGATLDAGGGFALTGNLQIGTGATFQGFGAGTGVYSFTGDVTNSGLITTQDGAVGDVITIGGNYVGDNGTISIDTVLGDDSSPTDKVIIEGDSSGSTLVNVQNVGGTGAPTVNGIEIIDVQGNSVGDFVLDGDFVTATGEQAVVGGAYGYTLVQQADGDLALVSQLVAEVPGVSSGPLYQPAAPVYEAFAQNLLTLNTLSTLQQRIGNRNWTSTESNQPGEPGHGGWVRILGGSRDIDSDDTTTGTNTDTRYGQIQIGLDIPVDTTDNHQFIAGINASYGQAETDVSSIFGRGDIESDNYSVGLTGTWYANNGLYADGQLQYSVTESELDSDTVGGLANDVDGEGLSASIEIGKRIDIKADHSLSLTPQAQLSYNSVDFDSFSGPNAERVSLDDGKSLKARFGLSLDRQVTSTDNSGRVSRHHLYGIANIIHEFEDETQVRVSGVNLHNKTDKTFGEIGLGGTYNWGDDKYSVYGELTAGTSLDNFGDSKSYVGTVGFRIKI